MPPSAASLLPSALLAVCACAARAPAQEPAPTSAPEPVRAERRDPGVRSSPEDIPWQLEGAGEAREGLLGFGPLSPLAPHWLTLKNEIRDAVGLDFALAYTALYQKSTDSLGRDEAGGGDFDFFGQWQLLGDEAGNAGILGFATEERHGYTALAPRALGAEIGSLWPTTSGFDTQDWELTQVWWEQRLLGDALAFRVGKVDLDTMFDAYALRSANYFFANDLFSANVSFVPPPAGLGAAVRLQPFETAYLQAGVADANGDRTSLDFDSFFDEHELFTTLELGIRPPLGPGEYSTYQATLWYVDERTGIGQPSGYGAALTVQHTLRDFVPFFRYAYADAEAGTVFAQQSGSVGFGLSTPFGRADDVFAFAIGGGEELDGSSWQVVAESFYRLQLTPFIQLTPSVQGIFNPIGAPDDDVLVVFGIRARILL